eukprot:scaffold48996_cov28-Phaeocystis_antarctica.AAC.2
MYRSSRSSEKVASSATSEPLDHANVCRGRVGAEGVDHLQHEPLPRGVALQHRQQQRQPKVAHEGLGQGGVDIDHSAAHCREQAGGGDEDVGGLGSRHAAADAVEELPALLGRRGARLREGVGLGDGTVEERGHGVGRQLRHCLEHALEERPAAAQVLEPAQRQRGGSQVLVRQHKLGERTQHVATHLLVAHRGVPLREGHQRVLREASQRRRAVGGAVLARLVVGGG